MAKSWGPSRLLLSWGCWQHGSTPNPTPNPSYGGDAGTEDICQAAEYVEKTNGFIFALPVLKHVYSSMRPIETFQDRQPGETLMRAYLRMNWGFMLGEDPRKVPKRIHRMFVSELSTRLKCEPFIPLRGAVVITDWELDHRRKAFDDAVSRIKVTREKYVASPTQVLEYASERDLRHVGYETRRMVSRYA